MHESARLETVSVPASPAPNPTLSENTRITLGAAAAVIGVLVTITVILAGGMLSIKDTITALRLDIAKNYTTRAETAELRQRIRKLEQKK